MCLSGAETMHRMTTTGNHVLPECLPLRSEKSLRWRGEGTTLAPFQNGRSTISQADAEKLQFDNIKHIIAVASGKGGVGKSTVSANLAVALAAEGANVGLLDADIYGPSQGTLLGLAANTRPDIRGEQLIPIEAHGVRCMSMSFLATENTPAIWRGPMASGAMQQLLTDTDWGDLDFLVIDMPPGTGDIQLTLAQRVPLTGAVIVTTPQDVALLDAKKGIEMFRRVEIPVLGIIENMSTHVCSSCGHEEAIFGSGGGEAVAAVYQTELLAQLPLTMELRLNSDEGVPMVKASPDSVVSRTFTGIANHLRKLADQQRHKAPVINIRDD
ncbi:MAG: iron-sulfur cluster carrier protein ApbC [Gammaproteobacteria bacterium]|jgi:ATP-binding protein involved in chromosome partitioning|nr:iron-sulfur cluster carrier protein ApbC [Gammaproteobacteria bacterium]MBT7369796.1 iron-sulfur cluster carrier protein ApbC [Gammaproteobacteria bacterium]